MTKSKLTQNDVLTTENFADKLTNFVGKQVTAYVGPYDKTTFENAISISGILEKHPERNDYRILANESTYTYFNTDAIEQIVSHETHVFKGGSLAVIKLKI